MRKEVYLEQQKKNSAAKAHAKRKGVKKGETELKQDKTKMKKKKDGFLSLIFKKEPKRHTVEDTLPYLRMLKKRDMPSDEKHFSKSIAFEDINYQLALEEDRDLILISLPTS